MASERRFQYLSVDAKHAKLTDGLLDVGLEGLGLGQLALHVCRKPYFGQRPTPGQDSLRVELGEDVRSEVFGERGRDVGYHRVWSARDAVVAGGGSVVEPIRGGG